MNKESIAFPMIEELIKFHFSSDLQSGYQAYRNDCKNYYLSNSILLEDTKNQLLKSLSISDFNWKEIAKRNDFFRYHDMKTNEELLLDLKVLCWDIFFPNSILDKEEQMYLKKELYSLLNEQAILGCSDEIEFDKALLLLNNDNKWSKEISTFNLITLFYDKTLLFRGDQIIWGFYATTASFWSMYSDIENDKTLKLDHEIGTNKWSISLLPSNS